MQANVDAAQAKYDEAHNRTSGLQAELDKALEALGDEEPSTAIKEHIKQLRSEIMAAERREKSYEDDLHSYQRRLESQEKQVQHFESEAEEAKAHIDEDIAKRNALLGDLEKAQAAYDDACKAYEEAKAAADKTTSPEITKPAETTKPSSSAQPAEATQPTGSSATGKNTPPSSTKQANSSSGKQADTTAGKLANTGDTAPSAIALAAVAAAGLGDLGEGGGVDVQGGHVADDLVGVDLAHVIVDLPSGLGQHALGLDNAVGTVLVAFQFSHGNILLSYDMYEF